MTGLKPDRRGHWGPKPLFRVPSRLTDGPDLGVGTWSVDTSLPSNRFLSDKGP